SVEGISKTERAIYIRGKRHKSVVFALVFAISGLQYWFVRGKQILNRWLRIILHDSLMEKGGCLSGQKIAFSWCGDKAARRCRYGAVAWFDGARTGRYRMVGKGEGTLAPIGTAADAAIGKNCVG